MLTTRQKHSISLKFHFPPLSKFSLPASGDLPLWLWNHLRKCLLGTNSNSSTFLNCFKSSSAYKAEIFLLLISVEGLYKMEGFYNQKRWEKEVYSREWGEQGSVKGTSLPDDQGFQTDWLPLHSCERPKLQIRLGIRSSFGDGALYYKSLSEWFGLFEIKILFHPTNLIYFSDSKSTEREGLSQCNTNTRPCQVHNYISERVLHYREKSHLTTKSSKKQGVNSFWTVYIIKNPKFVKFLCKFLIKHIPYLLIQLHASSFKYNLFC